MANNSNKPHPQVSLVIPCYNAEETVTECVNSCLRQDYPNLEIIFVDDGSKDKTLEKLHGFDGIKVMTQKNKGPAAARNNGWKMSGGEIVCFTDSDCLPNPGWVTGLVKEHEETNVGGVGGGYGIANPGNWLARCIHEEIKNRHLEMPKYVDYLGSFNVAYKRSVLEQVGGFDEGFRKASAEDNDLSYRIAKHGYKLVFCEGNRVDHHHPERIFRYLRQQYWHGYWRVKLYVIHGDMLTGDSYAGFLDLIQLPLSIIIALNLFLGILFREFLMLALLLVGVLLIAQIPIAWAIVSRKKDWRYFLYIFVLSARAFYRAAGVVRAILETPGADIKKMLLVLIQSIVSGKIIGNDQNNILNQD